MNKKLAILMGLIVMVTLSIFIFITHCPAFREPEAPAAVRDVLGEYAQKFPQGRLDYAGRIGDRFFIGIIVFPQGSELGVRYVLLGKFKQWEPIAEFTKLEY
ncbi:MAG: hypothetical protein U9R31_01545 [Candidatus Omnitrophota bacterium]|nr:hypothetical protein [Candidatus Omnitrophota bacterium]